MPTTEVILVDPIHKAWYKIMSSPFPLPFKADNQAIWQNHSEILHHCPCMTVIHHPFVCKYEQLFHEQSQNNSIKVRLFQPLHLHISVNMAVAQKINPMTLVCDGDVDKENRV